MKWAVDAMLGDVARYMLIAGEDVFYRPDCFGRRLLDVAHDEHRTFVTTSLRRLDDSPDQPVENIVVIPSDAVTVWDKLRHIVKETDLELHADNLFSRCLLCNKPISPIDPPFKPAHIPDRVYQLFQLYQCPQCQKIYWKGGHFDRTKDAFIRHGIIASCDNSS